MSRSDIKKSKAIGQEIPPLMNNHEPVRILEDEDTGDRFLIYAAEDGIKAEFRFQSETLWMTQAQIADFFSKDQSNVSRHISNIFKEEELDEISNMQKMHIANSTKPIAIYSLDMVISIGYRVTQSKQATLLRKWSTGTLVKFATSGFVVDNQRLSHGDNYDRLKELREIIRDIRTSEANVYREIKSICSICQDYDGGSRQAREFFARVQNKLLWAVTSKTAPEIIIQRANSNDANMGLQTWPNQNIRKNDVTIAHNYLAVAEIKEKNRLTEMLLTYFEDRLDIGKLTTMLQAEAELDRFIKFNDRALLSGKGKAKRESADKHAHLQYEKFVELRRLKRIE